MYSFMFTNYDSDSISVVNSQKRFLLLTGEANYCASNDEIYAIDENQEQIDELSFCGDVLKSITGYSESDTILVDVFNEEKAHSDLFNHPEVIKCRLVICGDFADAIKDEFKKRCYEIAYTGAEPIEDDFDEDYE